MIRNDVTINLKVQSIRSHDPMGFGGWTFFGKPADALEDDIQSGFYVEASAKVIGNEIEVFPGECWQISGKIGTNTISPYGIPITETKITASDAILIVPNASDLFKMIAESTRFKGIGKDTADNLRDAFHEDLSDTLKKGDIEQLSKIKGMSVQKAEHTIRSWENFVTAASLQFLSQFDMDLKMRRLACLYYDDSCEKIIKNNPWKLLSFSASFRTVDKIGLHKYHIAENNPTRFQGVIAEALYRNLESGHTAMLPKDLRSGIKRLLTPPTGKLKELTIDERLKVEQKAEKYSTEALLYDDGFPYIKGSKYWHPLGPYFKERKIAKRLFEMSQGCYSLSENTFRRNKAGFTVKNAELCIAEYESIEGVELGTSQRKAVIQSLLNQISIITGGAGTGKTTALKAIYFALNKYNKKIIQIALANRACRKLSEITGHAAYTIYHFINHLDEKLLNSCPYIVIDEASMVDVNLMFQILEKMPSGCHLIIVGDPVQLPPIGPGLVLHLLADRNYFPVVELDFIYRQHESTGIPNISNQIRHHKWPDISLFSGKGSGVTILPCSKSHITNTVLDVYKQLGGPSQDADVQILTMVKTEKYPDSSERINKEAHQRYSAGNEQIKFRDSENQMYYRSKFCIGDKVMFITKNYWSRGLLNGTLGYITRSLENESLFSAEEGFSENNTYAVEVDFDSGIKQLLISDLEYLDYSYAFTVHKAQGSQFKRVIVPILNHPHMLDHAMVYTALTRAEIQCVLIGDINALRKAVESPAKWTHRKVGLEQMIKELFQSQN